MLEQTHCCGMDVYEGITSHKGSQPVSPERHLRNIIMEWGGFEDGVCMESVAVVVFADVKGVDKISDMEEMLKFIREHKLGSVTVGRWKNNPNSANRVRAVTWNINAPKARALARKLFPDEVIKADISWYF